MKKTVEFLPAWDKRSADPKENYGIHGAEMIWYLKGKCGVIQFRVMLNWYLPQNENDIPDPCRKAIPADIGYHSPTPQYEYQMPYKCDLLPEGQCYYDGSTLHAEKIFNILVAEGGEAVWKKLEEIYIKRFGGLE